MWFGDGCRDTYFHHSHSLHTPAGHDIDAAAVVAAGVGDVDAFDADGGARSLRTSAVADVGGSVAAADPSAETGGTYYVAVAVAQEASCCDGDVAADCGNPGSDTGFGGLDCHPGLREGD